MKGMTRNGVAYHVKSLFGNDFERGSRMARERYLVPFLPPKLPIFLLSKLQGLRREYDIFPFPSFIKLVKYLNIRMT